VKISAEDRLEAFKMKALRQILRASRIAKKTNLWVVEQAGDNKILLTNVRSWTLRYFGHIMRGEDKSVEKPEKGIIQGALPGKEEKDRKQRGRIMSLMDRNEA